MPCANEKIVTVMVKEQEHRHQLQKTQMENWSRLIILKMWILTICSAGVFSIASLCIYQGKITQGS